MIRRCELVRRVRQGLRQSPVTTILGPRQCGKTTLAREILGRGHYFDLENPSHHTRLLNPHMVLGPLKGLVVLDEIQRRPDLLPLLRVLADRRPLPARFLILGSASPDLLRGSSETLAGRVHFVDMSGFTLFEVGTRKQNTLWLRGGFPESFLARTDELSWKWREDFIRTCLERDLPQLGVRIPATSLRRFWTMIAHSHGQIWNGSQIGASLGLSYHTTRHYLDLLTGALVIRQLPPWFENLGKRLVKAPKIYIRDSGILHSLVDLPGRADLEAHPKLGASWEGFAMEQVLSWAGERNAFFWATHAGAELDLLAIQGGRRWGFEFKCHDAPAMTKSMHLALTDLKLERLWVIHPGSESYPLHEKVECVALAEMEQVRKFITASRRHGWRRP